MRLSKYIKTCLFKTVLKTVLLYIIISVMTPLLLLTWIPCYIYRSLVIFYVKCFKASEFGNILDPFAHAFVDRFNTSSLFVVSVLKLSGTISPERIKQVIIQNLLDAKSSDKVLTYPQLRQYPSSFLGYWFWKYDSKFQLENHVKVENSFKEIHEFGKDPHSKIQEFVINRPPPKNQSPWNITLFTNNANNPDDKFVYLAIRIHHSMVDGKSMIKIFSQGLGNKIMKTAKESQFENKTSFIRSILLLPLELVQIGIHVIKIKRQLINHPWQQQKNSDKIPYCLVRMTKEITLDNIKFASRKYGNANTSVIVNAAIASALRKFFKKYEISNSEDFPALYLLPKPNHPDILTNHFFIGTFSYPIDSESIIDRVGKCQENFLNLRGTSREPFGNDVGSKLMASFPSILRCVLPVPDVHLALISNTAGEKEDVFVDGFPCTEFSLSSAPGHKCSSGLIIMICGYKEKIRFAVDVNSTVMKDKDLEEFISMLEKEIAELTC